MRRLVSSSTNIRWVVLGVVVICLFGTAANGAPWDGNGTPNEPYLIYDANDMQAIGADSNYWDAHFKLMADIDLSSYDGQEGRPSFNKIGYWVQVSDGVWRSKPFYGTFDGNGHIISNFTCIEQGSMGLGLFGVSGGTIKNLGLVNPYVDGSTDIFDWGTGENVGALVGSGGGYIYNCYVEGGSVAGNDAVGALVGMFDYGTLLNCYSTCSISSFYNAGGVVGVNFDQITNCYFEGNVSGKRNYIGGLVGQNLGTINNCYTRGSVKSTGTDWVNVGGLVGSDNGGIISDCNSSSDVTLNGKCGGGLVGVSWGGMITNCYATGSVAGTSASYIGGLAGTIVTSTHYPYMGIIEFCYATGDVSGNNRVGGLVGESGSSIVRNCYATGAVSANRKVGGLMGINYFYPYDGFGTAIIDKCYSTGQVTGYDQAGGLVGGYWPNPQIVTNSFWDIEASGVTYSAGGTGKTTAQMQTKNTFTAADWDFTTPIWTIDEGIYYPRLWWENAAPIACIVDGDRTVEGGSDCEARVTLDGSCSSDEDSTPGTNDDINDFDWYEVIDPCDPNSDIFLGTGQIIECNLPLGEYIIILEVIDKADAFDANEVTITVEDTTPPEFDLAVEPNVLWPANHKMVLITPTWKVSDNCDESPDVSLISISSSEDDDSKGDGHTNNDIKIGNDGSIYLRAERSGKETSRIYTITYQAVDDSGNVTLGSATVSVPHDRG